MPVLSVLLIKISNVWQKSKSCQSECPIQKLKMFYTEQELVWQKITRSGMMYLSVRPNVWQVLKVFKKSEMSWFFFLRSGLKSVIIIISFKSSLHENKWTDKWRQRPSIQWTDWALWFCQLSLWENKYTCLLTILQNLNNESGVFSAPDPIVDFSHFRLLLRNHWNSTTLPRSKIF